MRAPADVILKGMGVTVVGAGFAGVEAAWALAARGAQVRLYEMRPDVQTPAHTTGHFAELVCSNSFKSKLPTSPAGLLKEEMRALGSLVLRLADEHAVPGGEALAVDREAFSAAVTREIEGHPLIDVRRQEFLPPLAPGSDEWIVVASGPLSSPPVAEWLAKLTGRRHLYFYDAVSPTVEAASVDRNVAFAQSRYDKGGDDYLNCPFTKDEYQAFVQALVSAERVPIHAFEAGGVRTAEGDPDEGAFIEKVRYFSGCTPI
ncbi:MAG TPA: methylenetetrahydrofolate--tRNA-(uracil(54)-C(5))-methyltransferase (FADH(2)-oxidizing) TrmFO, partial [Fimbriimonadaceae bacterium]|nr:methylenetetrahydrofolate--tRNA-(uracil(54)-C(5))-methyltransferase (FADH(2)-oxidizing) TrmFO [Fimbriimonadaceae bacterium]